MPVGLLAGLAVGLQLGGSVSNFVDRVAHGSVTDYLYFGHDPVFNLADLAIVVGAVVSTLLLAGAQRIKTSPEGVANPRSNSCHLLVVLVDAPTDTRYPSDLVQRTDSLLSMVEASSSRPPRLSASRGSGTGACPQVPPCGRRAKPSCVQSATRQKKASVPGQEPERGAPLATR
jgi:hypothetical protein